MAVADADNVATFSQDVCMYNYFDAVNIESYL